MCGRAPRPVSEPLHGFVVILELPRCPNIDVAVEIVRQAKLGRQRPIALDRMFKKSSHSGRMVRVDKLCHQISREDRFMK